MSSPFPVVGDILLTSLLSGRYDRRSLRKTIHGLILSDLARMTEESFVSALRQKDQHIGRAFWCNVLAGLKEAYGSYAQLTDMRLQVEMAYQKINRLIRAATDSGATGPSTA